LDSKESGSAPIMAMCLFKDTVAFHIYKTSGFLVIAQYDDYELKAVIQTLQ